jgi:hypothetical protein
MKGIPREVAEHKLNIMPGSKPVKQRLCRFNNEKCKAIARGDHEAPLLTVHFGTPNMFIRLWFGFDYGTNPPLGTLIR